MVKDVAMHIAAANPPYISREDVPAETIEREKEIYRAQVTNKPPQVVEKILEGKLVGLDAGTPDHRLGALKPEAREPVDFELLRTVIAERKSHAASHLDLMAANFTRNTEDLGAKVFQTSDSE